MVREEGGWVKRNAESSVMRGTVQFSSNNDANWPKHTYSITFLGA